MPDKGLNIWQISLIESHLTSPHGPNRIAACKTAFNYGFTVEEIAALSEFPVWRVRQAILGEAVTRTTDD